MSTFSYKLYDNQQSNSKYPGDFSRIDPVLRRNEFQQYIDPVI